MGLTVPVPTSLPIDFESSVVTSDFINVSGGFASIEPNLQIDADNPSATVAKFVRSGGAPWAQSKLALTSFISKMNTEGTLSMKVYTDAPVGTLLKFKLESNVAAFAKEQNALTTVSGGWETYTWDLSNGDSPIYNVLTFMLGYATTNDASANATFLFDDIQQITTLSNDDELNSLEGVIGFPNPTKNNFTISSKNKMIEKVILMDVLGNQISVTEPNNFETTIDTSNFASGIYFAKISTSTQRGSIKFIVE